MNQKLRKVSYKMYLSAQGLILIVGVGVLIWNIIAALHDLNISSKAKACVAATLGNEVFNEYDERLGPDRWDEYLVTHAKTLDPSKKYSLKELLERKCSSYLRITVYEFSGDVGVYTKNYIDAHPATISERAGYIGLTIGITGGFLLFLFGAMKWLRWLLKD